MVRSTIRGTAPNALGQNYELARFAAPYDLDIHLSAGPGKALLELWPLVWQTDFTYFKVIGWGRFYRTHPVSLSITHISDGAFALSESFVILFVTPIRGGVTDEWGEGSQYIRLA
jgi:hypothetical protein